MCASKAPLFQNDSRNTGNVFSARRFFVTSAGKEIIAPLFHWRRTAAGIRAIIGCRIRCGAGAVWEWGHTGPAHGGARGACDMPATVITIEWPRHLRAAWYRRDAVDVLDSSTLALRFPPSLSHLDAGRRRPVRPFLSPSSYRSTRRAACRGLHRRLGRLSLNALPTPNLPGWQPRSLAANHAPSSRDAAAPSPHATETCTHAPQQKTIVGNRQPDTAGAFAVCLSKR